MAQPRKSRVIARDAYSTEYSRNVGDRIPHSDKAADGDPDRAGILITINQMVLAGVDIDDRAVEIATKLARWRAEGADLGNAEPETPTWRAEMADRPSWVYYVRCGNLIKIGTTTNLNSRLSSIRPNEVLALEPGWYELEAQRHRQFAELQASGEYFHPGVALQEHVRSIRQDHGEPPATKSVVPDGQDWFPKGLTI